MLSISLSIWLLAKAVDSEPPGICPAVIWLFSSANYTLQWLSEQYQLHEIRSFLTP